MSDMPARPTPANMRREFTHSSVTRGIAEGASWADPRDIDEVDWDERLAAALIPFNLDGDGMPLNPVETTDVWEGRNEFGHWGEKVMVDAMVFATWHGRRWLLMVERDDDHGWALPGGGVDEGEATLTAVVRELDEETGLPISAVRSWHGRPARYVPDPRASRRAWAVTVPHVVDMGTVAALPAVSGQDDARRAEWLPADDFDTLMQSLAAWYAGVIFPAHVGMLRDLL